MKNIFKNNPEKLKGKIIVITGGFGLIGSGFVEAGIQCGALMIILDNDKDKGKKFLKSRPLLRGKKAVFIECDIKREGSVKTAVDKIVKKFGRIDVLVNCAFPRNEHWGRKFEDVTYADFCENICAHLGGYFLVTKEVSNIMKKQKSGGSIINMGSIYGFSAPRFDIYKGTDMNAMPIEYAAIKGGILNFTKYLAAYLGKYNIRTNAISPGGVFDNQHKKFVKNYSKMVPLGKRMAAVDDLLGAFLFLASDESKYITGQNLVVDGGWSL